MNHRCPACGAEEKNATRFQFEAPAEGKVATQAGQALVSGLMVVALVGVMTTDLAVLQCGVAVAVLVWFASLIGRDGALFVAEMLTRQDDGVIGSPSCLRDDLPVRDRTHKQIGRPEPERHIPVFVSGRPAGEWVEIRAESPQRAARQVRKRDLWRFAIAAHQAGKWTREYWQGRRVGQRLWEDYRNYFLQFDVWANEDATPLLLWLRDTGYNPERSRTALNEPTLTDLSA